MARKARGRTSCTVTSLPTPRRRHRRKPPHSASVLRASGVTSQAPLRPRLLGLAADVGNVLFAWTLCIVADYLLVELAHGDMFAAAWEQRFARRLVVPTAVGALLPIACLAVLGGRLAERATRDDRARGIAAALLAAASGALAYGVSSGRHMASFPVRGAFVAGLATVGGATGWWLLPPLVRALRDWRPAAVGGVLGTAGFWAADALVLPRLYPAFHEALLALLLASAAVVSLVWSSSDAGAVRGVRWMGLVMVVLAADGLVRVPGASRQLRGADNLRMLLTEHAPLLGRAVRLAAVVAPPPPLDEEDPSKMTLSFAVGEIPRALDWTGHDVLLISVDALRADHASAYGYRRPTTPSIDALAAEGTLFDSAYCPTPHTSYSITSMMTGKAMRPLLALGLGKDSETWAGALRRYGYRTAAFYPPAVFFIDEPRFQTYEASGLDFEYRKVEFAPAARRVDQVEGYLRTAPRLPLFLWVHLFEPHEPYEQHPDHPFGPLPVDAYDSEVAEADAAIGRVVKLFREQRPGAVVIVTADHGEEFGEHGGHYHGTSTYEEQVHVPLVVIGPGVAPQRVRTVVQTIDLLPTTLSALGIPRPARIRGRDLGPVLAAKAGPDDPGLAYAETDDYTMLARGGDRLVCARKIGACALYDVGRDPGEQHDRGADAQATLSELRHLTAALERDQGRYEGQGEWPEALRRGLQGEADAAEDVSTLLDDAQVAIRRKAAEVLFRLHVQAVAPSVSRALGRDEDPEVRSWCALALVRMGEPAPTAAAPLLHDESRAWRRRAALAFAERGDARGAEELAAWWADEAPPRQGLDVEAAKELLAAMARVRDTAAVPGLVASLEFVPLRPWVADALGAIGDDRANGPLLAAFEEERYVNARSPEVSALLRLGVRSGLQAPLARFAGLPEPMTDAIAFAREAHVLVPEAGGVALNAPATRLEETVRVPVGPALRLLVLAAQPGTQLTGTAGGHSLGADQPVGAVHVLELGAAGEPSVAVDLTDPVGVLAVWVVAHAPELPPPAPVPFDAGLPDNDNGGRPDPHN